MFTEASSIVEKKRIEWDVKEVQQEMDNLKEKKVELLEEYVSKFHPFADHTFFTLWERKDLRNPDKETWGQFRHYGKGFAHDVNFTEDEFKSRLMIKPLKRNFDPMANRHPYPLDEDKFHLDYIVPLKQYRDENGIPHPYDEEDIPYCYRMGLIQRDIPEYLLPESKCYRYWEKGLEEGNKPYPIADGEEWFYKGCIIMKREHPNLPGKYEVSISDTENDPNISGKHLGTPLTWKEAKDLCEENAPEDPYRGLLQLIG